MWRKVEKPTLCVIHSKPCEKHQQRGPKVAACQRQRPLVVCWRSMEFFVVGLSHSEALARAVAVAVAVAEAKKVQRNATKLGEYRNVYKVCETLSYLKRVKIYA